MKCSLKLGSVAGIGVYLHWTFVFLIGWIFLAHLGAGQTVLQALEGVGFILTLFACVVLHEFGHALTAKRYGVATRDITLLPIGGVARLERIPEKPMEEFWVAIAGPAVNAVIAICLFLVMQLMGHPYPSLAVDQSEGGFLEHLMWVNLFIGAFNLLPAFPMDGGRILRSLLATRLGRCRSTAIAAKIGRTMAILFGIVGLFHNPILIFIAVFVYLGAQGEADSVALQSRLEGLCVRDAMITRFRTLSPWDTLETAVAELLGGHQQDFPVVEDGQVRGLLRRNEIVEALGHHDARGKKVADIMVRDCLSIDESAPLTSTLELMSMNHWPAVPVMRNGQISGLVTPEYLRQWLAVNSVMMNRMPAHSE